MISFKEYILEAKTKEMVFPEIKEGDMFVYISKDKVASKSCFFEIVKRDGNVIYTKYVKGKVVKEDKDKGFTASGWIQPQKDKLVDMAEIKSILKNTPDKTQTINRKKCVLWDGKDIYFEDLYN